jgi:hypothetical protein
VSLQLGTDGPRFVAPYRPDKGGVDFLGMRQVNLDMMANCLPGFNNATWYVRPFSVVSWIYWKFHQLAERRGAQKVSDKELRVWKEKVETLFTWGHKLAGTTGIPGTDARSPGQGAVPLDFASWKRSPDNTSLMAAVQYGPAAKTIDGLGFLDPLPLGKSLFITVNEGVELAEALDLKLRDFTLLDDLGPTVATAEDALELYPAWSIRKPSGREQKIFRRAFFHREAVGEQTPLGRRSTTLRLAIEALESAGRPLSHDEVRVIMFRGEGGRKRLGLVDPKLKRMWLSWVVLQIRQCQRFAMEGLLSWFERLLVEGCRDTGAVVQETLKAVEEHEDIFPPDRPDRSLGMIRDKIPSLDSALRQSAAELYFDPFRLTDGMRQAVKDRSDRLAPLCLRSVFFCAAFTMALRSEAQVRPEIERGASDRLSLAYWTDKLLIWGAMELEEFLRHFFEMLILSQHFTVAARRFDGQTQRLRISIEEDGLEFLADAPVIPSLTPDRLYTALSLMADCGLIGWDSSRNGYVVG